MIVTFLPFFLRPNIPKEGTPKGGTPESRVGPALKQINEREGGAIMFSGICDRYPNTEDYHVAMAYVLEKHGADAQNRVASRTFKGYFQDGIYPDETNLISMIGEVIPDLDTAGLQADLRSENKLVLVKAHAQEIANKFGITSVPYFVMNGQFQFAGAQDPEYILAALEQA